MSGLRYDPGTYRVALAQSVGPGAYILDVPGAHCDTCFPDDARVVPGTAGVATCRTQSQVDVESELFSLTRRATKNPAGQFTGGPATCGAIDTLPGCIGGRNVLAAEDTRLSNPPATLRETGWNRWEWLCEDPQKRAVVPFSTGVITQQAAKDHHRPLLHRPLDPSPAMPPGNMAPSACDGGPDVMQSVPRDPKGNLLPDDGLPELHWRTCSSIAARNGGVL